MPKVHNELYAKMNAGNAAARAGDGEAATDAIDDAISLIDAAIGGATGEVDPLPTKLGKKAANALEASFQLATTCIVNDLLGPARAHLVEACGGATVEEEEEEEDQGGDEAAPNPAPPPETPRRKKTRKKTDRKKKSRKTGRRSSSRDKKPRRRRS